MSERVIDPPLVRPTTGYHHAVCRPGLPVFLTGQVAWDIDGNVVGIGDIERQAEQAWANVNAVVAEIGSTRADIVKLTTYITDRSCMPAVGAAKQRQFAGARMPASTLVIVAGLADPDLLVEIEAIVMVDAS